MATKQLLKKVGSPFGLKYGPGGRSSNSGITATVFGGYGFIGRYVISELGSRGSRVYAPYRGDELEVRHLKPMFDLGQLGLIPFSPRDHDSIRDSLRNSDIVINLIGKHYETKNVFSKKQSNGETSRVNYSFEEVNVTIAETIAKLATEAGVQALIHVSALSADPHSKSVWNQTKARGEEAVRKAFPDAMIVRPATIFGHEDRFLNWIAETMTHLKFFPLLNEGKHVIQPVYSTDVAAAINTLIYHHADFKGRTFELAGPAEYSYKEVAEFVADVAHLDVPLHDVPVIVAKTVSKVTTHFINPFLTTDHVEQLLEDNVLVPDTRNNDDNNKILTFQDLDIVPTSMDKVAFDYLHRFRVGGHFQKVKGYH